MVLWLWPFQTYKTFCPYLIGSFEQVAEYLALYIAKGYRTYILDIPHSAEDLECAGIAFAAALRRSSQLNTPVTQERTVWQEFAEPF